MLNGEHRIPMEISPSLCEQHFDAVGSTSVEHRKPEAAAVIV